MARVTRIERPTDLRPSASDDLPTEFDEAWHEGIVGDRLEEPERDTDRLTVQQARPRVAVGASWQVFGAVGLCLAITLLLNTKAFINVVQAEPDGMPRTLLLKTAHGLDAVAGAVRLNRVNAWIDTALDRRDEVPTFAPVPTSAVADAPMIPAPATGAPATVTTGDPAASTSSVGTPIAAQSGPTASTAIAASSGTPASPASVGPVATQPLRAVTPDNPLRVYIAGDSFVDWLGYDFADYSKRDGYTTSLLDSKISSGLARPDYFDWPARISQAMARSPRPEAVVWFSGANDYADMRNESSYLTRGTPEWIAEYRKRAAQMMDIVGKNGGQLYWVGQPIMRDKARSNVAADINTAVREDAATRPWVHFIDTWSMFTDENGNYAAFLPDASGEQIRVRQEEGIHLTRTATTWVSERVYKAIQHDYQFTPP